MSNVIPEASISEKVVVPDGSDLFYFKLVGIGPKTLEINEGSAAKIVATVGGYFIVAPRAEIQQAIVDIVSRAFAQRKTQMEDNDGQPKSE